MFLLLLLTTALGFLGPSGGFQDDGHVDQTHGHDDGWGDDSGCAELNCKECTSFHNDCVFYKNECVHWNDVDEYAHPSDYIDSRSDCPGESSGGSHVIVAEKPQQSGNSYSYMPKFTGTCKGLGCLPCTEYHTTCVFYKNKCMDWKEPPMDAEMEDYTPHVKCPDFVLRYEEESVAMVHPAASSTGSQNLLVTSFALLGFGAMVYGAGKHYLGGKNDEYQTPNV